jgi:ATP-binding cassette subfamily F protein 3
LAKLEPVAARTTDDVREFVIPAPERMLSPPIIALDNVAVGYAPGTPVLRRLTLRIDADDRIGLLGANGNGKSTLTKLLAGRLAPLSGRITRADKLKIAYFAQHQLDELRSDESPYDHVRALMPNAGEAQIRARTGAIGFPGDSANTRVGNLSGGEKARLLFGLATFQVPHLVILDEPTNHLDIDSRAALIEAINDYPGAVVMVSHDRYLLEACADRLWLVADGGVSVFDGDLDEYRRVVLAARRSRGDSESDNRPARAGRTEQRRLAAARRSELAPLQKQIKSAEAEIAKLSSRIAEIDTALADPALYARDPDRIATLGRERAEATSALARAEDQWLSLSASYDEALAS